MDATATCPLLGIQITPTRLPPVFMMPLALDARLRATTDPSVSSPRWPVFVAVGPTLFPF